MATEKVMENISKALIRARTTSHTVFGVALVVAFVAWTNLAEREARLVAVQNQLLVLGDILVHADHTIRELRRYAIRRAPAEDPNTAGAQKVVHAFEAATLQADRIQDWIQDKEQVPFDHYRMVNALLQPLKDAITPSSPDVDNSPQSIIPAARLEQNRLRDLALLGRMASIDPIALNEVLAGFSLETSEPAAETVRLIRELENLGAAALQSNFDRLLGESDRLRQAAHMQSQKAGTFVVGGLFSSYEEAVAQTRAFENQERALQASIRGQLKIKVPYMEGELPAAMVVGLFPLGLTIGFGLINGSLRYGRKKTEELASTSDKRTAADLGIENTELRKGWPAAVYAWVTLIGVLISPVVVASLLVARYSPSFGTIPSLVIWGFVLLSFGLAGSAIWESDRVAREVK